MSANILFSATIISAIEDVFLNWGERKQFIYESLGHYYLGQILKLSDFKYDFLKSQFQNQPVLNNYCSPF